MQPSSSTELIWPMEEKEDGNSAPCPLFATTHCPNIKRGCLSITTLQHALKVEPVEPGPVSYATLQIVSFFFKVGAGVSVKMVFPKDKNIARTFILQMSNKYLPNHSKIL